MLLIMVVKMKVMIGWTKNDECWRMNDEGWWFQAVEGSELEKRETLGNISNWYKF